MLEVEGLWYLDRGDGEDGEVGKGGKKEEEERYTCYLGTLLHLQATTELLKICT